MVLLPSLLFVALLVVVHATDPEALHRPLSMFRDGTTKWVGYVLFALLLAMGAGQLWTYARARRFGGMVVPVVCLGLLVYVAVTPSFDTDHGAAAISLLTLVFFYYAARLYLVSSPWLFAHLAAPAVIGLAATSVFSYGVIQKSLILYFVFAVNVDCLLVSERLWLPGPDDFKRPKKGKKIPYRLKVIYRRYDEPAPNSKSGRRTK